MLSRDVTMDNLFDGLIGAHSTVKLALMQHCPPELKGKDAEEILQNPRRLYQAVCYWLHNCCNDFTHAKRQMFRNLRQRLFVLNRKIRKW